MSEPFKKTRTLDIEGLKVFLGMPTHRDLHPETVISLLDTQRECHERGIPLDVVVRHGNSLVHHARTGIANDFLKSRANILFWVDSDMVWEARDFTRLLALSTVMDMVAGSYAAKMDPPTMMLGGVAGATLEMNEFGCLQIDGIGLGFACMNRRVIEAMAAHAPLQGFNTEKEPVPHIFRFGVAANGNAQGEDMAFFEDARKLGFELWVDPTVTLGHVGPKVYRASLMDHLKKED